MKRYHCMPNPVLSSGVFEIEAVQPQQIENIRRWRNAQIDVLRQKEPIDQEQQRRYFEEQIWPEMLSVTPKNILTSLLRSGEHVGYGGLVHIDWPGRCAEVSFLLDPDIGRDASTYRECHLEFLELIKRLAFRDLNLDYLTTETFACSSRAAHTKNLERAGFVQDGRVSATAVIDGVSVDSLMHRCDRPAKRREIR